MPTVVKQADIRQGGSLSGAILELVEARAVLHDAVSAFLGKAEEVDVVAAAGSLVRLRLKVAAATAE